MRLRPDLHGAGADIRRHSWQVITTRSGYVRVMTSAGPVICARDSASGRWLANARAQLRRAGLHRAGERTAHVRRATVRSATS
jgi:hypothetical protein